MSEILANIESLWPYLACSWGLVLLFTFLNPQKYINSILLMIACFFTVLFVSGCFGKYMSQVFLIFLGIAALVLFSVPILLTANGIIVIKREGFSIPHLLSLAVGIFVGLGEIATVLYVFSISDYLDFKELNIYLLFVSGSVIYFSLLVLNFVVYSVFIQILPHRNKFDYVIIHGCGLAGGNRMTRLLSDRVDKAIEIYGKCRIKPTIIASGGKGKDEDISEAEAMKIYLISKGIPEESIVLEDKSTTTMENLQNSKEMIFATEGKKRVALVSSNFHIYRCLKLAKKAKMKCVGIGARVALYYWPTALVREFIAVFSKPSFLIWAVLGYLLLMFPVLVVIFAK